MTKSVPKQIMDAVPSDSVLVEAFHGETWNDGGSWHSAIFKLPDGNLLRVKMESDYHPNILRVETVREVSVTTKRYEVVK